MNASLITKQRHIRFYTTILLRDILSDMHPLEDIAKYYNLSLGEISTF